ncbi:putative small heat shock protein HSP20 [Medicago truncatula]|uniref:Putative small heat shock protein HSP20 n=1 Tax=Medicago truncatula TaxID=3880 RepID=A0A396ICX1_MEDTR|nr:putative small heat shock protein HSP20 [Medicago truncatula]
MKKEEAKVEIEDDRVLQISGKRSVEKEDKNDQWHPVERSSGKFMRRLRLPENAKMDQMKAAMENGILTVTVPKKEIKNHEVKTIDISADGEMTSKVDCEVLVWLFSKARVLEDTE